MLNSSAGGLFSFLGTANMVTVRQPAAKGLEDPALQGLPRANVRQPGQFDPRQFETIQNVPVFAEHQTTAKDGRKLKFGPNELKAVVDRCNRRITDTGDYAAITFGHTPDPNDPNGQMPDVAGFAGPFRLGTVGEDGARKRYAILADFHVNRTDMERFKRHPRRSPELWLENTFEEMFLDPIAVLGAEAPRLDLGLLYSKSRHLYSAQRNGRLVEKYAAASPSASNTFTPSHVSPRKFQAGAPDIGGARMIAPEELRQLMDAFEQTDIFQWARGKMEQEAGVNSTVPSPDINGPPPAGDMPPAPPMDAGVPPPDPAVPPAGPLDAGPPPPAEPGLPAPPAPPVPPQKFAAEEATGEYQTAEQGNVGGSKVDHDPIGTPTQDYAKCDDMDDDAFEKYSAGFEDYKKQRAGKRRNKYQADGSADGKNVEKPTEGGADYDSPGPMGDGDADDDAQDGGNATGEYQEASPPKKYSRSESDRQLAEVRTRLGATEKKLDEERGERVNAERYAKLTDLRQCYTFDIDKQVERVHYSRMSDQQFDEHAEFIQESCRAIPLGTYIPTHVDERNRNGTKNVAVTSGGASGVFAREKYSKADSDRARHICEVRRERGEEPDYETVLETIKAGTPIEP